MDTQLRNLQLSLSDLLGGEYTGAVCEAQGFLTGESGAELKKKAETRIDFYPDDVRSRLDELVSSVGEKVCSGISGSARGAGTAAFRDATRTAMAPLGGMGFIRIGEDGRVYLSSKSEHYHASLGHSFPGYRLIELARSIGVTNITHNNTRGHITRLLEERLIAAANGIGPAASGGTAGTAASDTGPAGRGGRPGQLGAGGSSEPRSLERVIQSDQPHLLNRIINLETGSLAVEAGLKMMLARFYRLHPTFPEPPYSGRTPVFLVMADYEGGRTANYHGTTVLTQVLRGMWPDLDRNLEHSGALQVQPVRINDPGHFQECVDKYERGGYKVAGFFHELVLMNYGGVRLEEDYVHRAHELCRERDIPVMVDEIQSCLWSPELFLFREYGLSPDFVSVGKGFPGGEYPASKILTTAPMDTMDQFGALVTNGQEELASLAYLITMQFAQANAGHTREIGNLYHQSLVQLAERHGQVDRVEGLAHLSSIYFHREEDAVSFTKQLNQRGIDISAQTYKANCPPSALTKLPLLATRHVVDFLVNEMDEVLRSM
jgi:acetylornithine/succinyldiaminopimelate/putrescine aminotransferase